MKHTKIKLIIKNILAYSLLVVLLVNLGFTTFQPVKADKLLGTNGALGSPILNQSAVSDDWNKYEAITWGIFLSNFCVPFVDDYESAFNLSSNYGSQGRGTKALCFGSGSDVSNNEVIQDLVTYAINMQKLSVKPLYVSYNVCENGKYTISNSIRPIEIEDTGAAIAGSTPKVATVADLLVEPTEVPGKVEEITGSDHSRYGFYPDDSLGGLSPDSSWALVKKIKSSDQFEKNGLILKYGLTDLDPSGSYYNFLRSYHNQLSNNTDYRYPRLATVSTYCIPTFAVKTTSGSGGYEVVLDLTDGYDYEMLVGAISYALTSDYKKDAIKNIFDQDLKDNYKEDDTSSKGYDDGSVDLDKLKSAQLYVDSFGNICMLRGGRYIIVVPASANKNITKDQSINLLNSIVFNAGTKSNTKENLLLSAGADALSGGSFIDFLQIGNNINGLVAGGSAFNNKSKRTQDSGMAVFYDTDTIAMQYINKTNTIPNAGELMMELFDTNLNSATHKYNFKIEPLNIDYTLSKGLTTGQAAMLEETYFVASTVANTSTFNNKTNDILTKMKRYNSKETIEMFESSYIIPVNVPDGVKSNGKYSAFAVYRTIPNFLYTQYLKSGKSVISNIVSGNATPVDIMTAFTGWTGQNNNYCSDIFIDYIIDTINSTIKLFKVGKDNVSDLKNSLKALTINGRQEFRSADMAVFNDINKNNTKKELTNLITICYEYDNNLSKIGSEIDDLKHTELSILTFGRLVKLYQVSPVLEQVSYILGMRDGTDFAAYSSDIYYTYLDWYGITKNKNGEPDCNFNFAIINPEAAIEDIGSTTYLPSKEDMERETLELAYLALHPTAGIEYRNQIAMSNFSNFMYSNYQRVVYGGSDTYDYSVVSVRNNPGFLNVNNYSENMFTSWFIDIYPTVAIYIMGIGALIVIVVAVLKGRKASWVMLSIIAIITTTLLMPSSGEFVPYLTNRAVNKLFEDKMAFWSISEQSANQYKISKSDTNNYLNSGLSASDEALINSILKDKSTLYLDRYLSIKQDISNKVLGTAGDNWETIQSMKSVRWMLPSMIREYTNNEGTADFVYVPLADKLEDCANVYFAYNPDSIYTSDALTAKDNYFNVSAETVDHGKFGYKYEYTDGDNFKTYSWLFNEGFKDTVYDNLQVEKLVCWRSKALTRGYDDIHSTTNLNTNNSHTYFYMLSSKMSSSNIPYELRIPKITYDSINSSKSFSEWSKNRVEELKSIRYCEVALEGITDTLLTNAGGKYDRYNRATTRSYYGYLWSTESPLHYFYQLVNDSFDSSQILGTVALELQGEYTTISPIPGIENQRFVGKEYRKSFMRSNASGETRDMIDLENLFTNVMPYMYQIQLLTGGYDDIEGIYSNKTIESIYSDAMKGYYTYKDNDISWIYRCNWVTKIYDNPDYNQPMKIRDSAGNEYVVNNPLFPQSYPGWDDSDDPGDGHNGRTMVFSKAQMYEQNLTEDDLNLVELKCIKINEDMEMAWTKLINYLSIKGVSREVFYRQMALEATMTFCKEFSATGFSTFRHSLYPSSLDLRAITFDSIMKLLLLNVTKNSSYIYGDTMYAVMNTSDVFTQFLLWINAWCCAQIIPIVRDAAMALVFYLGFISLIRILIRDPKEKLKSGIGYLGFSVLILLINIAYVFLFRAMIKITVSDQVIEVSKDGISVGNPIALLIIILVINLAYLVGTFALIIIPSIKHYKDNGFALFKETMDSTVSNMSSTAEKLIDKANEQALISDGIDTSGPVKSLPDPVNQGQGAIISGSSSGGINTSQVSNTTNVQNTEYSSDVIDISMQSVSNAQVGGPTYVDSDVDSINAIIMNGKSSMNIAGATEANVPNTKKSNQSSGSKSAESKTPNKENNKSPDRTLDTKMNGQQS